MRLISAASSVSLRQVIEQVNQDADYTLIAGEDTSGAVVMSLDTFKSLMETVHLLSSRDRCGSFLTAPYG